jgi:hypothetical protein
MGWLAEGTHWAGTSTVCSTVISRALAIAAERLVALSS